MKSQGMGIKMPLKYLKANVKIVMETLWKRKKISYEHEKCRRTP